MIRADVTISGPVFDSDVNAKVGRHIDAAQASVGQFIVDRVRQRLDNVLVNPSGNYRASVKASVLQESTLITDGGIVYGPWLEGTSSRNDRSRFKGYAVFRRTLDEVQEQVPQLVEDEVRQLVKELS